MRGEVGRGSEWREIQSVGQMTKSGKLHCLGVAGEGVLEEMEITCYEI